MLAFNGQPGYDHKAIHSGLQLLTTSSATARPAARTADSTYAATPPGGDDDAACKPGDVYHDRLVPSGMG